MNIITSSKDDTEIKKILPEIIPKLYRYIFDPNPTINRAMRQMWISFVPNSKKTIDEYFKPIMKELIDNLESNLWRVRQSCCDALNDIFSFKTIKDLEEYLLTILGGIFRVMDDYKESSQKAAVSCSRRISTFLIKSSNPIYTDAKYCEVTIHKAIPFLLQTGLLSSVEIVRNFSLKSIFEMVKVSKALIKEEISDIISVLLEQMSILEPTDFNSIQNFYGNSIEGLGDKLDELRMQMAKESPISECINTCLLYVDEKEISKLIPKLIDIIRGGVGLQTRVATIFVISDLVKNYPKELKQYVKDILSIILLTIKRSTNATERKNYADLLPSILKIGKLSDGNKVSTEILSLYLDEDNEESRFISGCICFSLQYNIPDIFKKLYKTILPLMFIARHDENEKIYKIFKSTWSEVSIIGTKFVVKEYFKEVIEMCCKFLFHSAWKIKKQGALAIKEISELLISGENINEYDSQRVELINLLVNSLSGQIWDGKTAVLDAIGSLSKNFNSEIEFDHKSMLESIIKESQRNSKFYKFHSIQCLNNVLKNKIFQEKVDENLFELYRKFLETEISIEEEKYEMDIPIMQKRKLQQNYFDTRKELLETMKYVFDQNKLFESYEYYFKFINENINKIMLESEIVQFINVLEIIMDGISNNEEMSSNEKLKENIIEMLIEQSKSDKFLEIKKNSLKILMKNKNESIINKIKELIIIEKNKDILDILNKF
jgi:proteasome component ECM29